MIKDKRAFKNKRYIKRIKDMIARILKSKNMR